MELLELTDGTYLDDIMEIEHECFTIPWSRNLFLQEFPKDFTYYIGILENGHLVGYGGMWLVEGEGHITNVGVRKSARGKGYGKELVQALIDYGKENGLYAMTLEVRKSNEVAISLYETFGFFGVGYRKGYYTDTQEDALIMWKDCL